MPDYGAFSGNIFAGPEPEEKGFLASIIDGIAADLTGTAKILTATATSPFEALGASVPVEFDEITTRDWIGLASVASMFVGGLGFSAARSVAAGQGLKGAALVGSKAGQEAARAWAKRQGALTSAALAASSEAGAGAFFGAVKPLENGERRLEEIMGDAALFGGLGGAFGLGGHALSSTIGVRLAQIKGKTKAALLQDAAKRTEAARALGEYAGIRLRNPETGAERSIQRIGEAVRVREGLEVVGDFSDFNSALHNSFSNGYQERLGLARERLTSTPEGLPQEILEALGAADGDLNAVIDAQHFASYKATREALRASSEESALRTWLAAETAVPGVDGFGLEQLDQGFRRDVLNVVPRDVARAMSKIEDPHEFLREAALQGALDVENLYTGAEMRAFTQELFFNDRLPADFGIFSAITPYDASLLSNFITTGTLAKIHPEIKPFADLTDAAAQAQTIGMRDAKDFMFKLENDVSPGAMDAAVEIIERSAEAGGVRAARREALRIARETGNDEILTAVERSTEKLNLARLRLIAAGRLGGSDAPKEAVEAARAALARAVDDTSLSSEAVEEAALRLAGPDGAVVLQEMIDDAGLAGYFPITHTGSVRAQAYGEAEPALFDSFNEARKFLAEKGGGFITNSFATDGAISSTVSPGEFGKLVSAIRSADGVEITAKEAADLLIEGGTLPSVGPRKFSRHLLKRRLGTRDYADSPFRALDLYLNNVERTLAFNTYERQANRIIENIPAAKTALRAWAEDKKNLMLGKPTRAENMLNNFLSTVAPHEIAPNTVRRYSNMLRQIQGLSKLGGFWSGVVNVTQFLTNSMVKLGPRYAAEGAQVAFSPNVRHQVERLASKHRVDLGLHMSLTREGELIGAEGVSSQLRAAAERIGKDNLKGGAKAGWDALQNAWMFSFNTAERFNRIATFWGAYKKGIAENLSEEAAVARARDIVMQTQFDYSAANLPTALQGPIGGVLGQFKTFFINEMEFIAQLTPKERAQLALTFQALGGAGAILAVPGADLVDSASRYFFDVKASEAIKLEGGKDNSGNISRFLAFGAPGLFNFDMTNYVGPGGFEQLTMGLLGPTVSDLGAWKNFFGQALEDTRTTGYLQPTTINTWMQQVMPAQIRRFMRGRAIYQTGEKRNPYSGKLMYRPEDRLRAAVQETFGAPTVTTAVDRIQDEVLAREVNAYRKARESYRRQIAVATIEGRSSDAMLLRQRAANAGYIFTPANIRSAVEGFSLTAGERRERRTPVALRTEFEEFFTAPPR